MKPELKPDLIRPSAMIPSAASALRRGHRTLWGVATSVFATALVLMSVTVASAQELYAPAPPPDAAFVRVVHADEALDEVTPEVGDAVYDALGFGSVSPYQIVMQGESALRAGAVEAAFEIEAGRFYTVALTGDGAALLEDPTLENSARALLVLYNFSELPAVELKTAEGDTEVIAGVEGGALGSVDVNPIAVAFGAFDGEAPITVFDEVQLGRGEVYSAFVLGTADAASAVFAQNSTQTLE